MKYKEALLRSKICDDVKKIMRKRRKRRYLIS